MFCRSPRSPLLHIALSDSLSLCRLSKCDELVMQWPQVVVLTGGESSRPRLCPLCEQIAWRITCSSAHAKLARIRAGERIGDEDDAPPPAKEPAHQSNGHTAERETRLTPYRRRRSVQARRAPLRDLALPSLEDPAAKLLFRPCEDGAEIRWEQDGDDSWVMARLQGTRLLERVYRWFLACYARLTEASDDEEEDAEQE